jgi:hypothetical protein
MAAEIAMSLGNAGQERRAVEMLEAASDQTERPGTRCVLAVLEDQRILIETIMTAFPPGRPARPVTVLVEHSHVERPMSGK